MKLVSLIEVNLSTYVTENNAKVYKVFELKPNVPLEVPDKFAQSILDTPLGGTQFFKEEDFLEKFFSSKEGQSLNTPFTEDKLREFGYDKLYDIAKEAGLNPNKNWKHETLIRKISELTAPVIE